jgi:CHASE2 domain-containing sensor protein
MLLIQVWQLVTVVVAAWLLMWAIAVWKSRRRTHDQLGGHLLALSWAGFLLATVVGTGWRFHVHAGFSPGMPFVAFALACGIGAQIYAMRRMDDE